MFTIGQNDNYALRSKERKLNLPKPNADFLKYHIAEQYRRINFQTKLSRNTRRSLNWFKRFTKNY